MRNAFQMSLECGLLESLSAHQYICTSAHQHYFAPGQLCGDDTNCRLGIVYNNSTSTSPTLHTHCPMCSLDWRLVTRTPPRAPRSVHTRVRGHLSVCSTPQRPHRS